MTDMADDANESAVDRWLASKSEELISGIAEVTSVDLGLREALISGRQTRLTDNVSDIIDVDKGLAAIFPPEQMERPESHAAPVEMATSLRLIAPDATATAVRATLSFDPADPYAVFVNFLSDESPSEDVVWHFARELLVTGLDEPAGIGDVRVWPWSTPRGDFVALALSAPDGNALFEVPRSVLVRFLRRTYLIVPRGKESQYMADPTTEMIDEMPRVSPPAKPSPPAHREGRTVWPLRQQNL